MKYLLVIVALLLASCVRDPAGSEPPPAPLPSIAPEPGPTPASRPQVLQGWLRDYDAYVRAGARKYPGLLAIDPARLSNFCPGFARVHDKAAFYADLLWSIAGPESDRHRAQITLEANLDGVANPIDPVTGRQVRSEGLLQLSYQDTDSYDAPEACPFDWAADKAKAIAEYATGAEYGDGTRSIHDAYKNLGCGLFIVNAHLTHLYPTAEFEDALRRYWVVMNPADPAYGIVRENLAQRQPACK